MRPRLWLWIGVGMAAVALGAAYALMSPSQGDLVCRHVAVTDSLSGSPIQGAEDVALDPAGARLILSAYDRRDDAPGGIYAVALDALLAPDTRLLAAERLAPLPRSPPLRPHGFDLGPLQGGSAPLVAILRRRPAGGPMTAVLQAYALEWDGLVPAGAPLSDPLLCNANDVVVDGDGLLVTTDRGACDRFGRQIEDTLGLARGRLLRVTREGVQVLASGIGFANGIAEDSRSVYVAATRGHALLIFDRARLGQDPPRRLPLAAAPDNLAWGEDGALYVAAHSSLLRFALYRVGLARDAASAIYRYDPAAGAAARPVLEGRAGGGGAVSGATVALMARGRILLGAGFDAGLSVCAKEGMP
jgi:hypothetical protein